MRTPLLFLQVRGRRARSGISFRILLPVLLGLLPLLLARPAQAQTAADMAFTTNTGALLEDMSSGTTLLVGPGIDDTPASVLTNIGFNFRFGGTGYTQFAVNANGNLRLGADISGAYANTGFVSDAPQLSPAYGDWRTGTNGYVRFRLLGTAPSRRLVVEWYVGANQTTSSTVRFQAVLYEGSNIVRYVYAGNSGQTVPSNNLYVGLAASASDYQSVNLSSNGSSSSTATNNGSSFTVAAGRYFQFDPSPTITNVSPLSGPAGTVVTVTGTNLTGTGAVFFGPLGSGPGGNNMQVNAAGTQLTVTVPPSARSGSIVLNTYGTLTTSSQVYVATPEITTMAPPSSAGDVITFQGINFDNASQLLINGVSAPISSNTSTSITVTIPATATSGLVTVVTPGGSYTSQIIQGIDPRINSFSPNPATTGSTITILGGGFSTNSVTSNGIMLGNCSPLNPISFTIVSATELRAVVHPEACAGPVRAGNSMAGTNLVIAPTIASFTPATGAVGTVVTVTTTGTTATSPSFSFNGTPVTVVSTNGLPERTYHLTVPAGATSGPISVTTAGGTSSSAASFQLPPTFDSFSPPSAAAGDLVTITGSNLRGTTGVRFGTGALATGISVNAAGTSLTALVPVNAASGLLTLTSPSGVASSGTSFTYRPRLGLVARLSPYGPLSTCQANTLTASAASPAFNYLSSGFNNEVRTVVVQPDGKVLIGGGFTSFNGNSAAPDYLIRLNADGSLDPSFQPGGTGFDSPVNVLALLPDGKVLAGGNFTSFNGDATAPDYLMRLNADGSPDFTFNPGGSGPNRSVNDIVVQPDGKILLAGGFFHYNGQSGIPDNLARLNADGSVDGTFNPGNIGFNQPVRSIALQPDGKILAGGLFHSYNGVNVPDYLVRINADGSLDTSFNPGGTGFDLPVNTLTLLPSGQVLAGGHFTSYNGVAGVPDYFVQLTASGLPDNTFNSGGSGFNNFVNKTLAQPDGQLLVGGNFTSYNGSTRIGLLRLNADGTFDTGFNPAGAGFNGAVLSLALQDDGKLLAGGSFSSYNGLMAGRLTRLNADGTPNDTEVALSGATFAFSSGGSTNPLVTNAAGNYSVTATLGSTTSVPSNIVAIRTCPTVTSISPGSGAAGDIVTITGSNLTDITGVRFGTGGLAPRITVHSATSISAVVPVTAASGSLTLTSIYSNTLSPGFTYTPRPSLTARLTPQGPLNTCQPNTLTAAAVNPAFNQGISGFDGNVHTTTLQPDGKVIAGGSFTAYNGRSVSGRLVRLHVDGSLDTSFNPGGTGFNNLVTTTALQPDGKILVGGTFTSFNGNAATADYLVRLNADGSLDPSFNPGGTGPNRSVNDIVVQPDGKILLAGGFFQYNDSNNSPDNLLRLHPDGSLDTSFNFGNIGLNFIANSLALQPDGKVLVGGQFISYNANSAPDRLLRVNPDGSLDPSFNPGGAGFDGNVNTVALLPSGKVLVGGVFTSYNGNAAAPDYLLQLTADGSLDTSFNNGGAGFSPTGSASILRLLVQPDGKVLAGGNFSGYNGTTSVPDHLLRLNPDGGVDPTFNANANGTGFGLGFNSQVMALALQADGKLVVGGNFIRYNISNGDTPAYNAAYASQILRLHTNGTLNNSDVPVNGATFTFSPGGTTNALVTSAAGSYTTTATVNGSTSAPSNTVAILPCATITGISPGSGTVGDLVTINGTNLEGATGVRFGTGGLTASILSNSATSLLVVVPVNAVSGPLTVVQPHGAVSSSTSFAYTARPNVAARLTPTGPLTTCEPVALTAAAVSPLFALTGNGFSNSVAVTAVQADGKILVGGGFDAYGGSSAASDYLLRLNADGSLDPSFNTGGTGFNATVVATMVQPDGKILVGGDFTAYNGDASVPDFLLRLNADGSLDTSFNPGGAGFNVPVTDLALQPNGKILVAGGFTSYNGNFAASDNLVRLNTDGSLDTSFNTGGLGFSWTVRSIALQPDGKILAGGIFVGFNNTSVPSRIARLNADGSLDTSFNPGGAGFDGIVNTVALQPNGKVLVGGQFVSYNGIASAPDYLLQLNADGSLDTSFNAGGTGFSFYVQKVLPQPDGKVLVGGSFSSYNGSAAVPDNLLRLHADGSFDNTFNTGGTGTTSTVRTLALQPDGKLLAGGSFDAYNNSSIPLYLTRLEANGARNNTDAALTGATFSFSPGGSNTNPLTTTTPGSYSVVATVGLVTSAPSNTVVLTACPAPTLTSLSPTSGIEGATVLLTGTNFSGVSSVSFNGTAATSFTVNSLTSLTTIVPTGATTGNVTVTTPAGTSNGLAFAVLPCLTPSYAALPFRESFEDTWASNCGTRDVPGTNWYAPAGTSSGWRRQDDETSAGWTSPSAGAYAPAGSTGNHSARFHTAGLGTGTQAALDLYLNLSTPGSKLVTFDLRNLSGTDAVSVQVSADGGQTFAPAVASWSPLAASAWRSRAFNINTVSATAVLRFIATSDGGTTDLGIDNVLVQALCPAPATYAALPVNESFENTWTDACATRDQPAANWQNLRGLGDYSWRRDDDGSSAGWGTPTAGTFTPAASQGNHSARFHSQGSFTGFTGNLQLFADLSAASSKQLTFDYINPSGTDQLQVQLSTDGGQSYSTLSTLTPTTSWSSRSITITSVSATAVLRFRATSDGGTSDIGLDNVRLSLNTPVIASLSASSGMVGDVLTITGNDLGGATGVSFNGITTTAISNNTAGSLQVVVPTGATTGNVTVTTPAGTSNGLAFAVIADLVVSTPRAISGAYRNVTVVSGGDATIANAGLQISGTMVVQSGGRLTNNNGFVTGTGSFELQAGAFLHVGFSSGISASGATGAIQLSGTRTFSSDADYSFGNLSGVSTGTGLPSQVRNLFINSASTVTLTQPVAVRRELHLQGGTFELNGQTLTLLSDAAGTALVVDEGGTTSGNTASVQRYLDPSLNPGLGYRHYSSPVSGNTVADLATPGFAPVVNPAYNTAARPTRVTPFPNVLGYEQSRLATVSNNLLAFDKGWVSPAALTTPLQTGRGYTVNITASQKVDFTGTLNSGDLPLSLTRNSGATAAEAGWHLMGNPYPSPLDWSLVAPADRANLDGAIYVFESNSQYAGTYHSYTNGVGNGNPLIATGQGFFVRVSAGQTSGTLHFRNAQRVTSYGQQVPMRRGQADTRPQLQLRLHGAGTLRDELYVYAETGATAGRDATFDALKLPNPTGLNLAAVAATGEQLAIQGLPQWATTTVVPLAVQVPAAGAYTFEATQLLNLGAGTQVYLRDALTGRSTLLTAGKRYGFALSGTAAAGRFSLELRGAGALATQAQLLAAQVAVYPTPAQQQLTLTRPLNGATTARATLLNSIGQVVRTIQLVAGQAETKVDLTGLASGVYSLRVPLAAGQLVTRRVVVE